MNKIQPVDHAVSSPQDDAKPKVTNEQCDAESHLPRFIPGETEKVNWKELPEDDPENPPSIGEDAYRQFQGYEQVGDYGKEHYVKPPPSSTTLGKQSGPPVLRFVDDSDLSPVQVKAAMLEMVAQNCSFGKQCAKEMDIMNILPTTAIDYSLESFCEIRTTSRSHCPFKGEHVDGADNGTPPEPWDIKCLPDSLFKDQKKTVEVPYTSYVMKCHRCSARGYLRCQQCKGRGKTWCKICRGRGRVGWRAGGTHCKYCNHLGWNLCHECDDDGRITCPVCEGYRRLRHFISLTVRFKTHEDTYITEQTDMPDELVRYVTGVIVFEQVFSKVWPITTYPIQEVNDCSASLIDTHEKKFSQKKRILQQRQILRGVPVTEVAYRWKGINRRFWVFGKERQIHAPDYPQQQCCGCQIL